MKLMKWILTSQVGIPSVPVHMGVFFCTQAELNSTLLNMGCKEL